MPRDQQSTPPSELAEHGLRYPNESQEYRKAREALLKDEQELVAKVKSVAEKRRALPLGGQLKEDYSFQWAGGGKVGQRVKFSELFGDKKRCYFTHGCSARAGTSPAHPARR